jgi:ribonuclease-3
VSEEVARPDAALEERLGYLFSAPGLLLLALTHPSRSHEQDGTRGNERLEFLGDAVLDLVVGELLYEAHPAWPEGHLSRARAALVNAGALATRARALRVGDHVRLGRTEATSGGAEKDRILANVLEAIIGALYLDGGLDPVVSLVKREFGEALAEGHAVLEPDSKTQFQEWAHRALAETPSYRLQSDTGVEDADDRFRVAVEVDGEEWGSGCGRTKRAAEQEAAGMAMHRALGS